MLKAKNKKLLVFDSGAGGLSISCALLKAFSSLDLGYTFDSDGFPYGNLNHEALLSRIQFCIERSLEQFPAEGIVIACNTASTLALDTLRARLALPIVGVVPAVKPAAQQSAKKEISVLATASTASGQYLDQLIEDFAQNTTVHRLASPRLVELAESFVAGLEIDTQDIIDALQEHTQALKQSDYLVLACTHFPLLRKHIDLACTDLGARLQLIDSTSAIVHRVADVFSLPCNLDVAPSLANVSHTLSCFSNAPENSRRYMSFLLKCSNLETLPVHHYPLR